MDSEFQHLRHELVVHQRKCLLSAIHDAAVRRKFLLQVKAKYAGKLWHLLHVLMICT